MTDDERFFALPPMLNEWLSEDELAGIVEDAREPDDEDTA